MLTAVADPSAGLIALLADALDISEACLFVRLRDTTRLGSVSMGVSCDFAATTAVAGWRCVGVDRAEIFC